MSMRGTAIPRSAPGKVCGTLQASLPREECVWHMDAPTSSNHNEEWLLPVQETQRLMPVVPLVVRQAQQDIKIGDTLVPKNTHFITHFLAMHTSERYWERPLDFIPVSAAMLCLA